MSSPEAMKTISAASGKFDKLVNRMILGEPVVDYNHSFGASF